MPKYLLFLLLLRLSFANLWGGEISPETIFLQERLEFLNNKFTLSNYTQEDRENNLQFAQECYKILRFLNEEKIDEKDVLIAFLHLSYKLANFYQQNDHFNDSLKTIRRALEALEAKFPHLNQLPVKEAFQRLALWDARSPSLYAALLHFEGKNYFYGKEYYGEEMTRFDKAEISIQRACLLREWIDAHLQKIIEPQDSNQGFYCSHTALFKRTLGYVLLEKGDYDQAKTLYEDIQKNEKDSFEIAMAKMGLIKTYTKLAHQQWNQSERQSYFQKGEQQAQDLHIYLENKEYSGAPAAAVILANFYSDPGNPYYNLILAKNVLEKVLDRDRPFSACKLAPAQNKLKAIYEKLAAKWGKIGEAHCKRLEEIHLTSKIHGSLPLEQQVKDLLQLAIFYRHQGKFLQAAILLGNALTVQSEISSSLFEDIYVQQYLLEKEFFLTFAKDYPLTFVQYRKALENYQRYLKEIRDNFIQNLNGSNSLICHQKLSKDYDQLLQTMFHHILEGLRFEPLPQFSLIALGSFSKQIPSTYSDLEFAIVHDAITEEAKQTIYSLSSLFLLRLVSIGETPWRLFKWKTPSEMDLERFEPSLGFRPDSGGVISHSFGNSYNLLGTIDELLCSQELANPILLQELSKGRFLLGSQTLANELLLKVKNRLFDPSRQDFKGWMKEDLVRHALPTLKQVSVDQTGYSLKHSFLRILTLLLSYAALQNHINDHNPETVLEELYKKDRINFLQKNALLTYLNELLFLRGQNYLKARSQKEDCVINDPPLEFLHLLPQSFASLQQLCHILDINSELSLDLIDLKVKELLRVGFADLALELLHKEKKLYWDLRGDILLQHNQPALAYTCYHLALKAKPHQQTLHFKLLEASLYFPDLSLAFHHLNLLRSSLPSLPFSEELGLKLRYYECRLARLQKDWELVGNALGNLNVKIKPVLKAGNLIHALIEMERGYYLHYQNNLSEAVLCWEKAYDLLARKFGEYHSYLALPSRPLAEFHPDILEKWKYASFLKKISTLPIDPFPLYDQFLD